MNRVLATHSLTAALVLYLTPSILELAFALRANINGHWDLVLYSCQLNAFLDQVKCQLAPLYNKDYWWCGIFSILPTLLDGAEANQPPDLGGHCYSCVLSFEVFLYPLLAFCAFSHVPYKRHHMDLRPFPTLILINVNDSFVASHCYHADYITVLQSHLHCCILLYNYPHHTLGILSGVHDPNVGQSLMVEKHSVN